MRAVMLYHQNTEQFGIAQDYVDDYKRKHHDREIELVSLETRPGADMADLYDVTSFPALLVISGDGQLMKFWQGGQLPLNDEVDFYMH